LIGAALAALEALGDVDPHTRQRLVRWLRLSDSVHVEAEVFGQLIDVGHADAVRIADALAENQVFERREVLVCVNEECGVTLALDSLEEHLCRACGTDLNEFEPRSAVRYVLERPRARDVGWLIALHGIRTRGPWQEQLQWLIDRQFLRTVPFRNWKYGKILFRAIVPSQQQRVVRRFLEDLRQATDDMADVLRSGEAPPPDVVAHSFGTWVVAYALQQDPNLRLGHVVLVGSIIRPDWPWTNSIERNQVTGILNYCGDRDPWVRLAERFIPDSGPSGRVGFTDQHDRLLNLVLPHATHSSAFTDWQLPISFEDVWRPFLAERWYDIDMRDHRILGPVAWAQTTRFLRAPLLFVVTVGALLAILVLVLVFLA
jgi:pimeloyl-ACP methyl ester carboxylesterase